VKKPYVIKRTGLFNCDAVEPFKVSRSQIEAFVECPRCFWLNHRRGMRRPSSPPFLITYFPQFRAMWMAENTTNTLQPYISNLSTVIFG
jgi:hypothetical protein